MMNKSGQGGIADTLTTQKISKSVHTEYGVPTELTEYTEAYGLVFFESTERIDAKRHTAECTELIANTPFISVDSCLAKRRPFCGFQKLKSVGFCVFCEFCGNYKQRNYKYKRKLSDTSVLDI